MTLLRLPSPLSLRCLAAAAGSSRNQRRLGLAACRCSSSDSQPGGEQDSEDLGSSLGRKDFRPPQTFKGFGKPPGAKPSPTEALLSSLGGVSSKEGRNSESNNIIIGSDQSEEKWRELDGQVNEYPGQRTFKAIGSGGQEFAEAMVACAEQVVGPIHQECISTRASAKGNYTSVTIECHIESPEQVVAIYAAMREDSRLKFFF